ncbi:T-cell surface glycoprotein CD3 epsilon chain [Mantella aurantiaca]
MKILFLLFFQLACLSVDLSIADYDVSEFKFKVAISGLSVTITCPEGASHLKKGSKVLNTGNEHKIEQFSAEDNGRYECGKKYLYLNVYVCEACEDVTILLISSILIADSLLTLGVVVLVYFGCKKKTARSSEIAPGGRTRGNKERPPPVPHPDYAPLQKRNQVVYDGLNKNYK